MGSTSHSADTYEKYEEKIEIPSQQLFSANDLTCMQNLILDDLHKHEIIIEVLPTSNVRISFYKNHAEHHLWQWLGITKQENCSNSLNPTVVIGTDDPGIFATNIKNEYSHIYQQVTDTYNIAHDEAERYLHQLIRNSEIYYF